MEKKKIEDLEKVSGGGAGDTVSQGFKWKCNCYSCHYAESKDSFDTAADCLASFDAHEDNKGHDSAICMANSKKCTDQGCPGSVW